MPVSPVIKPLSVSVPVAAVFASYTLLFAASEAVNCFAVMTPTLPAAEVPAIWYP